MDAIWKRARWKVVLLALLLDLLFGEPPDCWHPVVWMGKLISRLEKSAPKAGKEKQLIYGGVSEVLALGLVLIPAGLLERLFGLGTWRQTIVSALALKPTFAVKALFNHYARVAAALERDDLASAKGEVARIVSRNVDKLDEAKIAAAAVESLAENASDSVLAPIFFYVTLGLPGAYLYRMANTLDAMWGYRGRYEHLGKVAARVDDLLNLVPSRLAAISTVISCRLAGGSLEGAWNIMRRDASRTASPNAGWPMSAAAGALGVRLEKEGHYILNADGRAPNIHDLARARKFVAASLATAIVGTLLISRFGLGGKR